MFNTKCEGICFHLKLYFTHKTMFETKWAVNIFANEIIPRNTYVQNKSNKAAILNVCLFTYMFVILTEFLEVFSAKT